MAKPFSLIIQIKPIKGLPSLEEYKPSTEDITHLAITTDK